MGGIAEHSSDGPLSVAVMSANQLTRRTKLLDSVTDLVGDGFDETMSMKDIADRAGVALGTVYRYFSSKDHLLAAALVAWAMPMDERSARSYPLGASLDGPAADRLSVSLVRALRAYQRRPAFARLLVHVAASTDPFASETFAEMGPLVFGALARSIPDVAPEHRDPIMRVLGAVWQHCLVEWTKGRMTIADVTEFLDDTCHLLLPA